MILSPIPIPKQINPIKKFTDAFYDNFTLYLISSSRGDSTYRTMVNSCTLQNRSQFDASKCICSQFYFAFKIQPFAELSHLIEMFAFQGQR